MSHVYTVENGQMIKDYAYPSIKAERALKDLHDAVLAKRWEKAFECLGSLEYWTVEIRQALIEMRQRDEA